MAEYDLTRTICMFLDPHLTFPVLEFLCSKNIYPKRQLLECILEIVNKTNMIDYTMDTRRRLNGSNKMPFELAVRKLKIIATFKKLKSEVMPIMRATSVLKRGENMTNSQTFVDVLQTDYKITPEHVHSAYKMAKHLYECGKYTESVSYLYFCQIVMSPRNKNYLSVLWGKLAAEILMLNWNTALDDLMRLMNYIEKADFTMMQALQQRAWFVHWAMLVFFNHPKGLALIIDTFLYKLSYLNVIQTLCPHVLRYMSMAMIINTTRRFAMDDLIKIIQQEANVYRDPITEFLECLFVNFDFDATREKLLQCQAVIVNDFFIVGCITEFLEHARLMIFQTYCRIHKCMSITMIAEKLNMRPFEVEVWIIYLIRNGELNATINSNLGLVMMRTQSISREQQIKERIDTLTSRSEILFGMMERHLQLQSH